MAEQLVIVEIDNATGDFELDLQGFNGVGCKDVAKHFEKLGKVKSETIKPEYYGGPEHNTVACR